MERLGNTHQSTAAGHDHPFVDGSLLSAVWPETARRLQAFLRSRGVSITESEDIIQEVAIRALRSGVTFTAADDLVPWACTVAWRVHICHIRRAKARPEETPLVVDMASAASVEESVAARLRMIEVTKALARLGERDRQALLDTLITEEHTPPTLARVEAGRRAVERHRARARLMKALGVADFAISSVTPTPLDVRPDRLGA